MYERRSNKYRSPAPEERGFTLLRIASMAELTLCEHQQACRKRGSGVYRLTALIGVGFPHPAALRTRLLLNARMKHSVLPEEPRTYRLSCVSTNANMTEEKES